MSLVIIGREYEKKKLEKIYHSEELITGIMTLEDFFKQNAAEIEIHLAEIDRSFTGSNWNNVIGLSLQITQLYRLNDTVIDQAFNDKNVEHLALVDVHEFTMGRVAKANLQACLAYQAQQDFQKAAESFNHSKDFLHTTCSIFTEKLGDYMTAENIEEVRKRHKLLDSLQTLLGQFGKQQISHRDHTFERNYKSLFVNELPSAVGHSGVLWPLFAARSHSASPSILNTP